MNKSNEKISKNFSALVDNIKEYAFLSDNDKENLILDIIRLEHKFMNLDKIR